MDVLSLTRPRAETESGFPESDVEVPGMGTVRVRGLSRVEVLLQRKATDDDSYDGPRALVLERKMLAMAMLDPPMTESEVGDWQKYGAAGELDPVLLKVQELSGLAPDSGKSAFRSAGDGSGAGIRNVPSGEAEPDSEGTTGQPDQF